VSKTRREEARELVAIPAHANSHLATVKSEEFFRQGVGKILTVEIDVLMLLDTFTGLELLVLGSCGSSPSSISELMVRRGSIVILLSDAVSEDMNIN
jgi:hypothetical protein